MKYCNCKIWKIYISCAPTHVTVVAGSLNEGVDKLKQAQLKLDNVYPQYQLAVIR